MKTGKSLAVYDALVAIAKKAKVLVLVILCSLYGHFIPICAQDNPINNILPPSPNASNLGVYGKTPVGYHTGTPNINVPLYTLEEGDLEIPISLSYYAQGVKPNQPTSWVGLNWSLNCGGVITREIRMMPDETTGAYFQNLGGPTDLYAEGEGAGNYLFDSEPDMFYFNFGDYTGKFFVGKDGNFHTVPHHNFRIYTDAFNNDANSNINEFVIVADDGIKYTFGDAYAS